MVKRVILVTTLGLSLMAPVVAANALDDDQGVKGKVRGATRLIKGQVRRGVRTGQITPAELATLKAEMKAIHSRIKALRQSGQKPTPEQRMQIRSDLKKLIGDLRAAKRGG